MGLSHSLVNFDLLTLIVTQSFRLSDFWLMIKIMVKMHHLG